MHPGHRQKIVLDIGAYECKVCVVESTLKPMVFQNAIARAKRTKKFYTGKLIDQCTEVFGLSFRRPLERGLLVQPEIQRHILTQTLAANGIEWEGAECIVTLPYFCPPAIQKYWFKLMCEDLQVHSVIFASPQEIIARRIVHEQTMYGIIVDAGYSATTIALVLDGRIFPQYVRRLEVGGKVLSNFFKEQVSYRYLNIQDEFWLANFLREQVCFAVHHKEQVTEMLEQCTKLPNDIRRDFVLAPVTTGSSAPAPGWGHFGRFKTAEEIIWDPRRARAYALETQEQSIPVQLERFMTVEALFSPVDLVDLNQAGVSESVFQLLEDVPVELQAILLGNVLLIGGIANTPGLSERLMNDLREMAPDLIDVVVSCPENPSLYTCTTAAAHFDDIVSQCPTVRTENYWRTDMDSQIIRYTAPTAKK